MINLGFIHCSSITAFLIVFIIQHHLIVVIVILLFFIIIWMLATFRGGLLAACHSLFTTTLRGFVQGISHHLLLLLLSWLLQ